MRFRWEKSSIEWNWMAKRLHMAKRWISWDLSCLLMWSIMCRTEAKTTQSTYAFTTVSLHTMRNFAKITRCDSDCQSKQKIRHTERNFIYVCAKCFCFYFCIHFSSSSSSLSLMFLLLLIILSRLHLNFQLEVCVRTVCVKNLNGLKLYAITLSLWLLFGWQMWRVCGRYDACMTLVYITFAFSENWKNRRSVLVNKCVETGGFQKSHKQKCRETKCNTKWTHTEKKK